MATSITAGPYVVGEKPAPLVYTYQDAAGAAINLTGYTAKFIVRERNSAATTYNATVSGPTSGQVTYTWTGAEWPTAGHYLAEFVAGNGTNRFFSLLIKLDVRMPVGEVPAI